PLRHSVASAHEGSHWPRSPAAEPVKGTQTVDAGQFDCGIVLPAYSAGSGTVQSLTHSPSRYPLGWPVLSTSVRQRLLRESDPLVQPAPSSARVVFTLPQNPVYRLQPRPAHCASSVQSGKHAWTSGRAFDVKQLYPVRQSLPWTHSWKHNVIIVEPKGRHT